MTNFSTNAASMLESIYSNSNFGVEAVFSPSVGDDITCNVLLKREHKWEPGGAIQASMDQIIIRYQRADIDRKVSRGETFTIASTVFTVRSMADYPWSWTEHEGHAVVTEG